MRMWKILLLLITLVGCSPQKEDLLSEAIKVHNESIKLSDTVDYQIRKIEKKAIALLGKQQIILLDSVRLFEDELFKWKSNLIEVPGHEHHHHSHDHRHEPTPDLTPEMMLAVQKELNQQIKNLRIRTQKTLNRISNHSNQ